MIIDAVHRGIQKRRSRKRVGRGPGSGNGKTAARGHKGAGSRSGYSHRLGFEGGQMPLARRVAKRGFSNAAFATKVAIVNLSDLEGRFEDGTEIGPAELASKGLVSGKYDVVKVLGNGELTKKFTIRAHRFSKSAVEKIEKSGSSLEVIGGG